MHSQIRTGTLLMQPKVITRPASAMPRTPNEEVGYQMDIPPQMRRSLMDTFMLASDEVLRTARPVDTETKLRLYGLYKFIYNGECGVPKPSALNVRALKKWEAWDSVRGLSQGKAMEEYIDTAARILDRTY